MRLGRCSALHEAGGPRESRPRTLYVRAGHYRTTKLCTGHKNIALQTWDRLALPLMALMKTPSGSLTLGWLLKSLA